MLAGGVLAQVRAVLVRRCLLLTWRSLLGRPCISAFAKPALTSVPSNVQLKELDRLLAAAAARS
eukprot:12140527-Alexandrium_andersonii.AAC.1